MIEVVLWLPSGSLRPFALLLIKMFALKINVTVRLKDANSHILSANSQKFSVTRHSRLITSEQVYN